ncbi:MAG: carboxylating nicotinate-nucleotide diphosphorylase [Bacillota bacterium]
MNRFVLSDLLKRALLEDIGRGDLTGEAIAHPDLVAEAVIQARQPGRVAGLHVAAFCFQELDPSCRVVHEAADGDEIYAGQTLARIIGPARALLGAERVALNFLQRMSGIATATAQVVAVVQPYGARVVDTRKTVPGLRVLDKYAVRVGGGLNHRFGLDDGVLIKENHIVLAGGIKQAVDLVRRRIGHMVRVEVEVTDLDEVKEAQEAGVDAILLDNMDLSHIRQAVLTVNKKCLVEASGGITPDNAKEVASQGVDLISLGWLTHSVPALDLTMKLVAG